MKVDEIWVCVGGKAVDSLITKQHSTRVAQLKKKPHKYFKLNVGETREEWERASNLQTWGDSAFQAKIKNCRLCFVGVEDSSSERSENAHQSTQTQERFCFSIKKNKAINLSFLKQNKPIQGRPVIFCNLWIKRLIKSPHWASTEGS